MRLKSSGEGAARNLEVRYLPVGELVEDPQNTRKHGQKQLDKLAAGINKFGFVNPILIDRNRQIVAGHGRLKAALMVGMSHVPTILLEGLSESGRKALAIADNKLGDMSSFDPDVLRQVLAELDAVDYGIEYTAFDTAEFDILMDVTSTQKLDPSDKVPAIEPVAVSRRGDLWLARGHRLLCGDALNEPDYKRLLGDDLADIVFEDPPYNVPINGNVSGLGKNRHREFIQGSGELSKETFTGFMTISLTLAARFSKDGSIHYICMDHRHIAEITTAGEAAYDELKNLCVWDKQTGGMGSMYRAQHELIFVYKKGTAKHINNIELGRHGRNRTNVWSYPGLSGFGRGRDASLELHPTVKPVGLVADALRDCSKRGGLVLDAFGGSGTTMMAAERTGRRAALMEIDPLYVDTTIRRWEAATGSEVVLADDGRTFAEIKAERQAAATSSDKEA